MLKAELIKILEKLFALGGNHDTTRLLEMRDDFLDFLREEDQLFMSHSHKNITLAKDAVYFIDAHNTYAITTSRVEAGRQMKHIFERLINAQKWNYYELKFLIGSLHFTDSVKHSLLLANKSLEILRDFKADPRSDYLAGLVAFNTISRILHAKFFDDHHGVNLEEAFAQWFFKLELQIPNNDELQMHFKIAEIKQAVFRQNIQAINQHMKEFETNYDEKMLKLITSEVNFYISSKRYNLLYREKFNKAI
jgi:hypothetical protein